MRILQMVATFLLLGANVATSQPHAHPSPERAENPEVDRDAVLDSFVMRAREAGVRYQDRRTAISDGFRRLGPDFPSMGEHWVHPARMVDGELDADFPQALSYAIIRGVPTLTGVIYAKPLLPGEEPPDFPPGTHAWHDHSGSIDEESVVLRHSMGDDATRATTRLAMLHVWSALANPGGVFESENWALPFARLSFDVPERFPVSSAKALSLASGSDAYYLLLFKLQARPDPPVAEIVEKRIGRARLEVDELLSRRRPASALGPAELTELEEIWVRLWTDAGAHLSTDARAALHDFLSN